MNTDFWASVWLSVAIGMFVGYTITEGQIEAAGREPIELKEVAPRSAPDPPTTEIKVSLAPAEPSPEAASEPVLPRTVEIRETAEELHAGVVAAQHGGIGSQHEAPTPIDTA